MAGGDEQIDVRGAVGGGVPGGLAMAQGQAVEEPIFALQEAKHGSADFGFDAAAEAGEEGVGEADEVGLLALQPGDERLEFARLVAFLAAQHGKGHLAQIFGARFAGGASGEVEEPGRGEKIMEPAGEFAKEGGLLLEIDADAAEENRAAGALVGFVEGERQIKGRHERVVAEAAQGGDEGVIPHAGAAEHLPGAGRYLDDLHLGAR